MNEKHRTQVVELLRCAADHASANRHGGFFGHATCASNFLGSPKAVRRSASRIAEIVICGPGNAKLSGPSSARDRDHFIESMLEAALRTEDREWP